MQPSNENLKIIKHMRDQPERVKTTRSNRLKFPLTRGKIKSNIQLCLLVISFPCQQDVSNSLAVWDPTTELSPATIFATVYVLRSHTSRDQCRIMTVKSCLKIRVAMKSVVIKQPLNRSLLSHSFLQVFRNFDYWTLDGGWLLKRWPLNRGSTVYRVG